MLLSELLSNSFLLKEFDLLEIRRESSLSTWAMKLCSHQFACLLHNKIALAQNGAKLENKMFWTDKKRYLKKEKKHKKCEWTKEK